MNDWTIEPVAPWWAVAISIGIGLALLAFRPAHRPLSVGRTRSLLGIRTGLIILMALAMLRPGCIQTVHRPQRVTIAVAMDTSRSMQLPHEAGGLSRLEKLNEVLGDSADLWQKLATRFEFKAFTYDAELRELSAENGVFAELSAAEGAQTDHGLALDQLAERLRGDRVAALFLMGDGVQNADFPRVELPRALREIQQLQAPLFAVPFGRTGVDEDFVDIAVSNLADQFAVFVKNSLEVQATIRARGFANQAIPVQLVQIDGDGSEKVVQTTSVTPTLADQELPVELAYVPELPGEFRLVVRAAVQSREVVERNNELSSFLTVHEGGLKVLYLEGRLDLEQRYLRRSLAASQDLQVDFLWIDHRDRSRWPIDLSATLSDPSYDVVILGDLDSRSLHKEGSTSGNLSILADRVSKGLGLVTLGGRQALGPGRYQRTPLADVLPIRMNEFEAQDFETQLNGALHLDRELVIQPRESHFLTRLGEDDTTSWSTLPPLLGANRIAGVKSSSRVLLETDREEPLLVIGTVGGRVVTFAGDTTWRWWTQGRSDTHRRFWRQVVLWAAGLDSLGRDAIVVDLDRRRFAQGSPVSAEVGARTAAGDPLVDAVIEAALLAPDGTKTSLAVSANGTLRPVNVAPELLTDPGLYSLEVSAKQDQQEIGSRRVEFVVFDDDREKGTPAADPEQLARLSAATRESGGDLVSPDRLRDRLEALLAMPIETDIEIPQRWRLGESLMDAALFVFAFVGLLGLEWWLRRRWGLV